MLLLIDLDHIFCVVTEVSVLEDLLLRKQLFKTALDKSNFFFVSHFVVASAGGIAAVLLLLASCQLYLGKATVSCGAGVLWSLWIGLCYLRACEHSTDVFIEFLRGGLGRLRPYSGDGLLGGK